MSNIQELQQKIKENPNDLKAIEEYAIALSNIGEIEEAYKNFMFLKSKMPENPVVYYNLGIILEKLKDINSAIKCYELSLDYDETNFDVMFNLANLYIKKNKFDEAEDLLIKIVTDDADDENALFYLGQISSKRRNHELAIEYFSKALQINPADVIAKFYLAYSYKEIGNIDLAIQTYQELIKQAPDYSWAYYNLSIIYLEQGDEEKAIFYLERTININSKDISAIKLACKIFMKHKKYAPIEKLLLAAVKEMPLEADLSYLLSRVYIELRNKANYLKYCKMTIENESTFSGNIQELKMEVAEIEKLK